MHRRNILGIIVFCVALNVLAWISPMFGKWNFCDWYIRYIFPVWYNTYGRFSDLFLFSVGEILICIAIVLVVFSVLIGVLYVVLSKKKKDVTFIRRWYIAMAYMVSAVLLIMTLNCTILYHATPLSEKNGTQRSYTVQELETLRNYIVEKCNSYTIQMERNQKGYIRYEADMQKNAKEALHNIAKRYPNLGGYYPNVKHMMFSNLMSQSYMGGYYFPFSMEANCNGNMYITNYPATYCHELSHLHGYIYEDEANFLAFLACIESEDIFFQYSGYLSVLYYIDNEYWDSIGKNTAVYAKQPRILEQVFEDNMFLTQETWEEVEEDAIVATETIEKVSETFTETTLQLNGVTQGMASYSLVTKLILEYYDGILY